MIQAQLDYCQLKGHIFRQSRGYVNQTSAPLKLLVYFQGRLDSVKAQVGPKTKEKTTHTIQLSKSSNSVERKKILTDNEMSYLKRQQ